MAAGVVAVEAAPLLAGGPPGWLAYGLLVAGTLGLTYLAAKAVSADDKAEEKLSDQPVGECTGDCGKTLPENPDELLDEGWEETSHPKEKENGRRRFKNPETGEEIIFDKGKPEQPGWGGRDHYHRPNPNKTNRHNEYLDKNGHPVRNGSEPSHIAPGTILGRPMS
jgi:hypothetical protein